MAVLTGLPAPEVIIGLRGVLDFYLWKGLAVVRTWPKKPAGSRAPLVQAHIAEYTDFNRRGRTVASELVVAWTAATAGTTWTWHDAWLASAYGNANS